MRLTRWFRTHWDRVIGWSVIAVGAIVLWAGWNGLSQTPYPAEQIPFVVSGGIGGGLLVVLGAALLISADLRDEWHKLDRIDQALRNGTASRAVEGDGVGEDDTTELPTVAANGNGSSADAADRVSRSKAHA